MKQLWVVVFIWYFCVNENYLFTRADEKFLNLTTGGRGIITCENNLVISIERENIYTDQSYCSSDEIQCDSSGHDIRSQCNGLQNCTIDFPRNTSCMKEDRYFNLSYLCLAPTNVLCTFEYSFCIWKNTDNRMFWKRDSPLSRSIYTGHLPKVDQTTGSGDGNYLYLTNGISSASISSGNINFKSNGDKCLELWFSMGKHSKFRIYKIDSKGEEETLLKEGDSQETWHQVYIPLGQGLQFEIVIEGHTGNQANSYISIDDTDIQEWPCIEKRPLSEPIKCNFERDFCNLTVEDSSSTFNWIIKSTGPDDWRKRPLFDHTKKDKGSYVCTESVGHYAKHRRRIIIQFDNKAEDSRERCLSLWYYRYNRSPGHLNIYSMINDTEIIVSSINNTRKDMWHRLQVTVYNADQIILEYNFTFESYGGLALDDIYVSPVKCSDDDLFFHECVDKHADFHITCPTSDIWNETTAFDPNISMSCQTITTDISVKLNKRFRQCNDIGMCMFSPADLFGDHTCSSKGKYLNLTYTCKDMPIPMTESTPSDSFTSQAYDSTIFTTVNSWTLATSLQTDDILDSTSVKGNQDGIPAKSSSSASVIGIVAGVVFSAVIISVGLVIAVVYFRRSRYLEKKAPSNLGNVNNHSDYVGHQNVAFSPAVNGNTQTDYSEIRTSKHNEQYHDISDTFRPLINTANDDEYSEIANVVNSPNNNPNPSTNYQHQYISLDPNDTGFDRSIPQNNLHNESKNNHINSNEMTSFTGGDDYAILDPDDLNESKKDTSKVLPLNVNYVVLDPNETGFNRQESTDTVCNYELATSINPKETSEDPYDVSKDETYDTSYNSRHKEKENNIYSHTVDNVYDTAGNQRKKEESDATYDHFFGQQSEDDYDISKPL